MNDTIERPRAVARVACGCLLAALSVFPATADDVVVPTRVGGESPSHLQIKNVEGDAIDLALDQAIVYALQHNVSLVVQRYARNYSLLGIDGARLIALVFTIAGMLAGLAGAFAAWHYGPVDFRMGTPLGFKALTAAVVGGLGSVPGAFIGGITVAAVETLAAAAIGGAWRDVIVFGLLAGMLVLRPRGIAGDRL